MTNFALFLARDTGDWTTVQGRRCSDCTLCCRVMPVNDPNLVKRHNIRCQHQRHMGCSIYDNRPGSCRNWSCGWLVGFGVDGISRPDRAGYLVDPIADFVTCTIGDTTFDQPMVVVWVDPKCPDRWRSDTALRDFFERWGEQGFGAMVRYSSTLFCSVFPKSLTKLDKIVVTPLKESMLPETDPGTKFKRAEEALRRQEEV